MEIRADRRMRRAFPDGERRSLLAETARRYLQEKLRLARLLIAADRAGEHLLAGDANVIDYAVRRLGLPRRDLPLLLDLGRSLDLPVGREAGDASGGDARGGDASGSDASGSDASGSDAHGSDAHGGDDGDGNLGDGNGVVEAAACSDTVAGSETSAPVETVGDQIASGRLSIENAALLGELARDPGLIPEDERARWVAKARLSGTRQLRRDVRKRIESARQGGRTITLPLEITESARDDFHRARDLASRRARRVLTAGQTFAVVVRRFVREEDRRQRGTIARRVPHTATVRRSRYVPAEVEKAIRGRAEDRCEVGGCSHGIFLELMHVGTPHAQGGAREVRSLALGCTAHHVLLDAGVIRFDGWTPAGTPRFAGPRGLLDAGSGLLDAGSGLLDAGGGLPSADGGSPGTDGGSRGTDGGSRGADDGSPGQHGGMTGADDGSHGGHGGLPGTDDGSPGARGTPDVSTGTDPPP